MANYRPRRVTNLSKAEMMPNGPFSEPKLRGRAADGIRFQNKVHRLLAPLEPQYELHQSQWIRFRDAEGWGWCQVDSLGVNCRRIIVVESKLSLRRHDTGVRQLSKLYAPILRYIYNLPVLTVLAFHHWVPGVGEDMELVESPLDLMTVPIGAAARPIGWHVL